MGFGECGPCNPHAKGPGSFYSVDLTDTRIGYNKESKTARLWRALVPCYILFYKKEGMQCEFVIGGFNVTLCFMFL